MNALPAQSTSSGMRGRPSTSPILALTLFERALDKLIVSPVHRGPKQVHNALVLVIMVCIRCWVAQLRDRLGLVVQVRLKRLDDSCLAVADQLLEGHWRTIGRARPATLVVKPNGRGVAV